MEVLTIEQVKQKLKEIIAYELDADIAMEDIRDDISLYEDGIGLDSITLVNFIVLIEKKFNFSFTESDISAELFSSINKLAQFIETKTENAVA